MAPIPLLPSPSQVPTDPHHPIHLQFFSDGLPIDYDRKANLDHYKDTSARPAPKTSPPHRHLPHNFSCIVMNPFVPWVSDVAAQHRIPAPCSDPTPRSLRHPLRRKPLCFLLHTRFKQRATAVVRPPNGPKAAIVVSSPEITEEILKHRDATFSSRTITEAVRTDTTYGATSLVFVPYGSRWRSSGRCSPPSSSPPEALSLSSSQTDSSGGEEMRNV
ncbi:hypothetical protein Syun_024232 [Stephania yunnanensis]|uniref:Uncharacterized protein n=1 Tax=Stephania yunnanensis TaxID=152371 RepID=A0AAP0NKH4_9MAGN